MNTDDTPSDITSDITPDTASDITPDTASDITPDFTSDTGTSNVRYLSLAWIRELTREVAESQALADLANEHSIGVTQVVTDGPEGDVTYHLQVGGGSATFGAGPADPEDVRMQQEWATAVAVATGEMNAQEAFITGRILLFGDQQKLLTSQPVFGALDQVFTIVRERTSYE